MKTILAVLLLWVATPGYSQTRISADRASSTIRYSMVHPLHEWDGISRSVTSVVQLGADGKTIERVAVRVPVASFDSGNASRDSHMMEVTEALTYPELRFGSTSISESGSTVTVSGTLSFHGVDKPVTFTAQKIWNNGVLKVTGGFPVKLTDFGIDPPRLLGVATENTFTVAFDVRYAN